MVYTKSNSTNNIIETLTFGGSLGFQRATSLLGKSSSQLGHLQLAAIIVESYRALPPGEAWLGARSIQGLVLFGGDLFSAGLAIALPVGFAIILVQLVMAMLARSAPQMNIFAVGLPATLMAGLVLLAIAAPVMADGIGAAIQRGLAEARLLATGGG